MPIPVPMPMPIPMHCDRTSHTLLDLTEQVSHPAADFRFQKFQTVISFAVWGKCAANPTENDDTVASPTAGRMPFTFT